MSSVSLLPTFAAIIGVVMQIGANVKPPNILQVYRDRAPLRRNVELAEVADTAVFLLGPGSRAITGEIVMVDGGFHISGGI